MHKAYVWSMVVAPSPFFTPKARWADLLLNTLLLAFLLHTTMERCHTLIRDCSYGTIARAGTWFKCENMTFTLRCLLKNCRGNNQRWIIIRLNCFSSFITMPFTRDLTNLSSEREKRASSSPSANVLFIENGNVLRRSELTSYTWCSLKRHNAT